MRVVADNEEEALTLALSNMPNDSTLRNIDGTWSVSRTMQGVWTVFIFDAAVKAIQMDHIPPHSDTKWYEEPASAAFAILSGWHTAYGQLVGETSPS
jgi:hypothetical protein